MGYGEGGLLDVLYIYTIATEELYVMGLLTNM